MALVVIVCICAVHGTGYHNWDIRPEWFPTWGKATFSQNLAFIPAGTLTKVYRIVTKSTVLLLTETDIYSAYISVPLPFKG